MKTDHVKSTSALANPIGILLCISLLGFLTYRLSANDAALPGSSFFSNWALENASSSDQAQPVVTKATSGAKEIDLLKSGSFPTAKNWRAGEQDRAMVFTRTRAGEYAGLPIANFQDSIWNLAPSGSIQKISKKDILTQTSRDQIFQPESLVSTARGLRDEFGQGFLVHLEHPYVIVCRSRSVADWAERLKRIHASVLQFSNQYELVIHELDFPLIAIVLSSQQEFFQYSRACGQELPENCVGYYSQETNRILLYEDPALLTTQDLMETIYHESAHQIAFNVGLHQRCAATPNWIVEGFAVLFEAPSFSVPKSVGGHSSPWPRNLRSTWKKLQQDPRKLASMIESLIRSDSLFTQDSENAYAVSWGMIHYLATKHPDSFSKFLYQTSQLPPLLEFSAIDRVEHFRSSFGNNLPQLTIDMMRHLSNL